jgi:hypothetical protein
MATVDKLVVRIEADMKDLKSKLKSATTATQQSTNKMKASFAKLKTSVGGVGRSIFSLKGALIGLGVGAGLKSLINVGNEVESLQIRFETLFGSAEEGAKAFEIMAKFAGKVPFSLQQIQAGSGSLLAVAGDAEELGELLEMTGTIAAATGLDFRTASEQIQRSLSAGIGAADLFRDRGVTAMLGFKAGTQVSVKETREALEKFAKDNDGITDKLANTFAGTMSMLGDSVFSFQRTVNDAGFFSSLTAHFSDLKTTIDENQVEIAQFAKDLSEGLVGAMNAVRDAVVFVADNFTLLKNILLAIIGAKIILFFGNMGIALYTLAKALGVATIAQKGFNIAVLRNPYVRVGMVLVGTIGLVVSAYKLLTENQKELTTAVKESNKALTEEQTLNAEKLAIAQQMNEFYEKNGGRPDGVDEFGGTKEAIKLAKANEEASDITITSIDKLIQAEKDNQAQLSLSAFELAKYNILKEEGTSLTTIQVKEKLALLEVQMKETARLIEEEKALDLVTKQMETHVDAVKKLTDENALLNAELLDATETELLQMAMRQANTGATHEQIEALELLIAKNQELKEKMAIKEENEETKTKKEEDEDQAVLDLVNDLGLLKDAQQEYTDAVARLGTALDEDLISLEQYGEGLRQLKMTLLESTEEGKIAIEGLERVQDLLFDNLADALLGAEDGWKNFRDGLKSIVRDIISDLLKLQAQQAMTKLMGGGGGSGGGGFDFGKILSFGSSFFGGGGGGGFAGPSSMGSVGYGRANGGTVTANQPYMVGEQGPEMFVPNTSGGVFTNRSLKNSGGGGATVNQTINIETGVAQTVRAELQSLMPQIKMETVSAVIDAKKRGGQMADTFS